jgi:hypothetical protein
MFENMTTDQLINSPQSDYDMIQEHKCRLIAEEYKDKSDAELEELIISEFQLRLRRKHISIAVIKNVHTHYPRPFSHEIAHNLRRELYRREMKQKGVKELPSKFKKLTQDEFDLLVESFKTRRKELENLIESEKTSITPNEEIIKKCEEECKELQTKIDFMSFRYL